ncbi:hypothetical protein [Burkholderia vietnamiensis]|uniref:hypothetical protein n=1 Tax=Burkholderia vietnamiensis TaxID=60552 RepID=UPI001BA3A6A4|nr:hypothetical protein [Burkholderia vietnamiensis]MBR8201697.1 hypothetical protein [Burkholderia vietnamiensis]
MTVTSSQQDVSYDTDGSSTTFPIPFYFLAKGDIVVDKIDGNEGIETLILGTDFDVSGEGNENGGTLTLSSAYPNGFKLHIYRDVPATQETEYQQNDAFPAKATERALDKLTMLVQGNAARILNAIRYPLSEFGVDGELPRATERAGKMLGFDEAGNRTLLPIPASVGAGDLRIELWKDGIDYTAGVSTGVTLSRSYGTKPNIGVVIMGGVAQSPNSYTLNGTTLTFVDSNGVPSPIPVGVSEIWCIAGTTLSVWIPPEDSVGDAQIAWRDIIGRNVDSIAELRALKRTKYNRAFVAGYYIAGDGGGGPYILDEADTSSDDNGGTIIVAADGGRWKLLKQEFVTAHTFGAKAGDAVADTAAIQAYINALPSSGGNVNLLPGTYLINTSIQIGNGNSGAVSTKRGIVLRAVGNSGLTDFGFSGFTSEPTVKLKLVGAAAPVIQVQGPIIGWGIQNIAIDCNMIATHGIATYSASNGDCRNLTIYGHTVAAVQSATYPTFAGVGLTDSIQNCWHNTTIKNPDIVGVKGVVLDGAANSTSDYHLFTQLTIQMSSTVANNGIYLRAVDSCGFIGVHIFGSPPGGGGIVFDYSFRPFWPSGCWFQAVDNGCGWANIGTPGTAGGTLGPNVLHSVLGANGASYPELPNLVIPALPGRWASKTFLAQTGALATTAITPYTVLEAGLYRLSGYLVITAAGSAGGLVTPHMTWNDGQQGNQVNPTSVASDHGWTSWGQVVYCAAGTNISYQVDFSGITTSPTYKAYFNVEKLS